MNKAYLILLVFILCVFHSNGQVAELQIDKKHSVDIKPCIADGSLEIPEGYYESGDTIYFIVKPKGDWEFSKGNIKSLQTIKIKQSENSIPTIGFKEFVYPSNKTYKILISFERKAIVFTDQFVFILEEFISDIMEFPEHFWPYYSDFNKYYNLGKQFVEQHQYIEAFWQLKHILPGADHATDFSRFSNYQLAYSRYIPEAVTGYQKKRSDNLQTLWKDFESSGQISAEKLEMIKLSRDSLKIMQAVYEPYFIITDPTIKELSDKHAKLIKDYSDLYSSAYDVWKKSMLESIENGNYEDGNRYEVYIELLARMLVYTNSVEKLSVYDSLDISLIASKRKQVSFLKKDIDLLEKMQWKEDFISIATLMNDEIELNSSFIGQTHLLNLRGNKESERQPNYYIINGFNELAKGNFESFKVNIDLAIAKCTNLDMMYYLELWSFMYQFKSYNVGDELLENVNTGLEYQKKGMLKQALESYDIADRMGNSALPPFLIGLINLKVLKELFPAERYFNDALAIHPGFALANIYNLKILIDSKQFDMADSKFETALELPELSVWYIYYLQSKLFFLKQDYEGSLRIIQTKCKPLNEYSFEQFIMLGDIYLKLNNCGAAKENYLKAGELQPNNRSYSSRMQMLISQCNN